MGDRIVSYTFQEIDEPYQITFDIRIRVIYGISYSGLGCQATYLIKLLFSEKRLQCLPIRQIYLDKSQSVVSMALHNYPICYLLFFNSQQS